MNVHEKTASYPGAALDHLHGGLVVSCQARPGNPMAGSEAIALLARSAEYGGARGLRVNGPRDIAAVQRITSLPIIGINRIECQDSQVTITPTLASAKAILEQGIPMVALDATCRPRPDGEEVQAIVEAIHAHGALALGDVSMIDDLGPAIRAGVDAVGTTLSGYTGESPWQTEPDFALLAELVKRSPVPVFAEGRFWSPDDVVKALDLGAMFVVVGTAITSPMAITSRFVTAIEARGAEGR